MPSAVQSVEYTKLPIAELIEDPANANTHPPESRDAIRGSLRFFGQVEPLVIQKSTRKVIGGNGRLTEMRSLGQTHADVVLVDCDNATATSLGIALNRSARLSVFDEDILAKLLSDMPSTDDPELDAMFDSLRAEIEADKKPTPGGGGDEFDPTPSLGPTRSQKGELWAARGAGREHLLFCGDSTNPTHIQHVLGGRIASLLWTDPPWGVAIGKDSNPRHRQRDGLVNDDLPEHEFGAFLAAFASAARPFVRGDVYCVMGASAWPLLDAALRGCGYHWSATVIWVKDLFVLGRSKYHRRYEPIWYGWPEDATSSFCERRDLDDVWEIARPKVSEEHPTMKPIELVQRAIQYSSKAGDLVLDTFGGSGTTLVAANREGRDAALVEIDPVHFDTCLRRAEAEGLAVEKIGSGLI